MSTYRWPEYNISEGMRIEDNGKLVHVSQPAFSCLPDLFDVFFRAGLACFAHKAYILLLAINYSSLVSRRLFTSITVSLDSLGHIDLPEQSSGSSPQFVVVLYIIRRCHQKFQSVSLECHHSPLFIHCAPKWQKAKPNEQFARMCNPLSTASPLNKYPPPGGGRKGPIVGNCEDG